MVAKNLNIPEKIRNLPKGRMFTLLLLLLPTPLLQDSLFFHMSLKSSSLTATEEANGLQNKTKQKKAEATDMERCYFPLKCPAKKKKGKMISHTVLCRIRSRPRHSLLCLVLSP